MTCINALVRRDRVHVMTDGSVWEPDGTITGTTQKVHILAQAHAVIAVRGPSYFPPCLVSCLNGASLTGFDDLLRKVPEAARFTIDNGLAAIAPAVIAKAAKVIDLTRADVVVAGWSHERGRGEIHKLDTSEPEWRLEPQGDGFIMPGDNPALGERLQAASWNLHDERRDEAALLALMHHQRAVDDFLPNGARFPTVGGFAQHTIITPTEIRTRIVERWEDRAAA